MKIILDFQNDNSIKIMADDDNHNFYRLVKKEVGCDYSLWFNDRFVWERNYASTGGAVASVLGSLVDAMKI